MLSSKQQKSRMIVFAYCCALNDLQHTAALGLKKTIKATRKVNAILPFPLS
jgi:hypothetical protein